LEVLADEKVRQKEDLRSRPALGKQRKKGKSCTGRLTHGERMARERKWRRRKKGETRRWRPAPGRMKKGEGLSRRAALGKTKRGKGAAHGRRRRMREASLSWRAALGMMERGERRRMRPALGKRRRRMKGEDGMSSRSAYAV
jgi:hypothetical protein